MGDEAGSFLDHSGVARGGKEGSGARAVWRSMAMAGAYVEKKIANSCVENLDKLTSYWCQLRVVRERGRFYLRVNVVNDTARESNGVQFIKLEPYEAEAFVGMGLHRVEEKK